VTDRNRAAGFLILRLFFAQFWLLQVLGKARDQESGVTSLHNLAVWSANVTAWMVKSTPLPGWAVRPYTLAVPFVELLLGLLFLLGLRLRAALLASGALLVSLDVGLMLQMKHDVVAMNTVVLLAALVALQWEPKAGWSLDALLARRAVFLHPDT
jgi:thiosulfate dehydrogenase [quinone] large subunit